MLGRAVEYLRPGDVLVVVRLDRLGRSVTDILVARLRASDVRLESLTEKLIPPAPSGTRCSR